MKIYGHISLNEESFRQTMWRKSKHTLYDQ